MKKSITRSLHRLPVYAGKIIQLIKFTAVLLLLFLRVSAAGYSQTTLSVSFVQTEVEKAFQFLEKENGACFLLQQYRSGKAAQAEPPDGGRFFPAGARFHFRHYRSPLYRYRQQDGGVQKERRANPRAKSEREDRRRKGRLLPNITIQVKGTGIGTLTDAEGAFSLDVPAGAILVVSGIGYIRQEIAVEGRASFNIVLKEDVAGLSEVVVVGYGSQEKHKLTSAVATVSGAEAEQTRGHRSREPAAGQLPGLQVSRRIGRARQRRPGAAHQGIEHFQRRGQRPACDRGRSAWQPERVEPERYRIRVGAERCGLCRYLRLPRRQRCDRGENQEREGDRLHPAIRLQPRYLGKPPSSRM